MRSWKKSTTYFSLRFAAKIVRVLPPRAALLVARVLGRIWYLCDRKHRIQVYRNIKQALSVECSSSDPAVLTRKYFSAFTQNFIEFLRLPVLRAEDIQKYVRIEGQEEIQRVMDRGKGAVFMTMHCGNWEMAVLALRLLGYKGNVIYKRQENASVLDHLLEECRRGAYEQVGGVDMFERGAGARNLIRSLQNNEMVGMVIDQGGKDGLPVKFFGRETRIAQGGLRLAEKTGAGILLFVMQRERGPYHRLVIREYDSRSSAADTDRSVKQQLNQAVQIFEYMLRPSLPEYMWMYKIWKFDRSRNILILDDGRTGHLRQSQAVAREIGAVQALSSNEGSSFSRTVPVIYCSKWSRKALVITAWLGPALPLAFCRWMIKRSVTAETFDVLFCGRADIVISAGTSCAPLNRLWSREDGAKNIQILKPGVLPMGVFDQVILPEHDLKDRRGQAGNVTVTKGAPNLIDDAYLESSSRELLGHYSHLKMRDKFRIGVLLGGDTKNYVLDESLVKILVNQLKDVSVQLNADIMITTSRRTSRKVENLLFRELKKDDRCPLLIIANRQNVPEAVGGILALSDVLVVSGDSISMVSEAATAGRRVVVFPVKQRSGGRRAETHKHHRFIDRLNGDGYILSSEPRRIGRAIYDLAKNKIVTRRLDSRSALREGLKERIL
ncbi:MAG: ELM1/GtrOC1 family putative glycosyltransferase [Candidatus Omnitrophota bacterium]